MSRRTRAVFTIFLFALLVACGSGSNDNGTPNTATNSTNTPTAGNGGNTPGNTTNQGAPPDANPGTSNGSGNTNGNSSGGAGTASPGAPTNPTTSFTVDPIARFNHPTDLTIDSAGNLYVMDSGNHDIRKITTTGQVVAVPGFYGDTARIAADQTGNLFVLDGPDISKITPDGVTTKVASYLPGPGHYTPIRIAADAQGHLFILLWYRNDYTVERYTADGNHVTAYKFVSQGTALDMASDSHGNLMVALNNGFVPNETYLMSIPASIQATTNQTSSPANRTLQMSAPEKLAFDPNGNLYLSDLTSAATDPSGGPAQGFDVSAMRIRKLGADNSVTTLFNGFPNNETTSVHVVEPPVVVGTAADANGNVYFCNQFDHAIYKIDSAGQISVISGKPGEPGGSAGHSAIAN